MPSFTIFEWLTLANTIALLAIIAAAVSSLRKQKASSQHFSDELQSVKQAQAAITKSSVGMGRHIKQMESLVQGTHAQTNNMASIDETTYQQASRLVALGATATDLVESCGISRTEAEMMVSLREPS